MSTRSAHSRFFDVWSRFYGLTPFLSGHLRRIQRDAIARLGLPGGARVLDLGCGPGDGLRILSLRRMRAVGGDLSREMTRRARAEAPAVRLVAERLPFRSGVFDGVVCTNSFHHHPDPEASLAEMRRVLRVGGRVVLADPAGDQLLGWLAIRVGEARVFGLTDVHVHARAEWRALLGRAGFGDVVVERAGRFDPRARASYLVRATAM